LFFAEGVKELVGVRAKARKITGGTKGISGRGMGLLSIRRFLRPKRGI